MSRRPSPRPRPRCSRRVTIWALLAGVLASVGGHEVVAQSPTAGGAPEDSFSVQATALDEHVRVDFAVARGFYLLATKLAVRSADPAVVLGPLPALPTETLNDPFFGSIDVLRGRAAFEVPYFVRSSAGVVPSAELEITSQGCTDGGECFAPQTRRVKLDLPPRASSSPLGDPSPPKVGGIGDLIQLPIDSNDLAAGDQFLDPDVAFVLEVRLADPRTAVAEWRIEDGYYLYGDKFAAKSRLPGLETGALALPKGKVKDDPYFGRVEVFYGEVRAQIPLRYGRGVGDRLELEVQYQGCAEAGLCYPPITKTVALSVPPADAGAASAGPARAAAVDVPPPAQDRIARTLAESGTWLVVLGFFGFGLLLGFTPCVLPMIPILSGIISGQGAAVRAGRAFVLSAVFVLAMAFTYTAAGVLAGLFGADLQVAFQNPWVLSAFSALFVGLALSMFGFYELQLPVGMQTALARWSSRQAGGSFLGVAVMGLLSALVVGPSVAAPLAGALIYIGKTGDALLGGLALFSMSLGMGVPLLAVGTSAGRLVPAAGPWTITVKAVFGVALLGVAIYLLERIVAPWISMLLWAVLFIVCAIYLGALDSLSESAPGWRRLSKGVGLVALTYGVLLMVGAATGADDMLRPLKRLAVEEASEQRRGFRVERSAPAESLHRTAARARRLPDNNPAPRGTADPHALGPRVARLPACPDFSPTCEADSCSG